MARVCCLLCVCVRVEGLNIFGCVAHLVLRSNKHGSGCVLLIFWKSLNFDVFRGYFRNIVSKTFVWMYSIWSERLIRVNCLD